MNGKSEQRVGASKSSKIKGHPKSPLQSKMFLVAFEYEVDMTLWRMSDEDLQDFMGGVLGTVAAGHTEGPVPKVVVRIVRDGGEVLCSR